ncbi:polyhydroxyalkanoate granule-associated phasin [Noviherbaspirillum denitrificans]|uniref:Phasin domain-containing protein n=1 Tax=Noviherbaspirillum denitrificans TaxID=1968433 RepID=A0A254TH96_9BURK|nr:polyhydroxyalkanoate granule-associated phasin [Noviherbaspirillum denitrificans]OWW20682.1 hypothetical protein AYR66_15510 [Noviherbaspirillum denitrificans]
MARYKANTQRLGKQWTELFIAAPQVVMHRTSRMAMTRLSARDQAEFSRMCSEKVAAFYQSWASMWTTAVAVQYELATACSSAAVAFASNGTSTTGAAVATMANAATKVASAGLAPVHKKAVANARRLSRSKR